MHVVEVMILNDINFDEAIAEGFGGTRANAFRPMHETLKKCACGFVGTKHKLEKHLGGEITSGMSSREWWKKHGEVPYYG